MSEVKHNPMSWVAQEGGASWHGFKNARFTFDSQVNVDPFKFSNEAHQGFRLMGVQAVHNQVPFAGIGVSGDSLLHMSDIVDFGASLPNCSLTHNSTDDITHWRLRFGCRGEYIQTLGVLSCLVAWVSLG